MPREPRVQTSYAAVTTGTLEETWHRIDAGPEPAPVSPEGQNRKTVVVPPDASERPKFGEYVYVEELPAAITKVPPVYPGEARRAGVEGTVTEALVLEDGSVGERLLTEAELARLGRSLFAGMPPYSVGVHRLSALEFLARWVDHVPERYETRIRYYGAFATKRRVWWRRRGIVLVSAPPAEPSASEPTAEWPALRARRRRWA